MDRKAIENELRHINMRLRYDQLSALERMYLEPEKARLEAVLTDIAKADSGKPKLTLVPRKMLFDIAEVREYGTKKIRRFRKLEAGGA